MRNHLELQSLAVVAAGEVRPFLASLGATCTPSGGTSTPRVATPFSDMDLPSRSPRTFGKRSSCVPSTPEATAVPQSAVDAQSLAAVHL